MPLDEAYCNALLLAYWSVRQKLNHVQFSYVALSLSNTIIRQIDYYKK